MSIIINALTKADKQGADQKKHSIKHLFFTAPGSRRSHHAGFWIGLSLGILSMVVSGGVVIMVMTKQPAETPAPEQQLVVKKTVPGQSITVKDETKPAVQKVEQKTAAIDDLDEPIASVDLGPDIDEELQREAIIRQRLAELEAIDQRVEARQESQIPVRSIASDTSLPEMVISGVVWDFADRYVFINGVPYKEQQMCGEVLVEAITLSSIMVKYKDKEYEIVLQ